MAGTWPAYAQVLAQPYAGGQDSDVERTPFDDGAIRQEKRFEGAWRTRNVTALLDSDADKVAFEAWAAVNAHQLFGWTDPEDGTVRLVRVRNGAGGIAYDAAVENNRRTWEASMTLEGPR